MGRARILPGGMTDTLKLALVGCGAISPMHLFGIREGAPEIEITAAIDPDPERARAVAESTGARPFASLDEALEAGGFDAVDLMLPHHLHEAGALQAFAAGRHVMLEKPMAPSLPACERILEAAAKAGTVFMVAENAQYWPEVGIVSELLEAGAIGELVTARASLFFPPLGDYYAGDRPWRFDRAATGGGVSIDTGSHWIRPLRIWLGEVDEVVAALERPFEKMEGESLARALLRFRSGRVANLDLLLSDAPLAPESMFRLTGTAGEIVVDAGSGGRVVLYDAENRKGKVVKPDQPQGYLRSYAGEFADFAQAVLHGRPLAAGPESSLGELRTALAMERSAETRSWEKVW